MRFSVSFTSLCVAVSCALGSPLEPRQQSAASVPSLSLCLTGEVLLGTNALRIPTFGNQRLIEPIIGGNVTGLINGTFSGGMEYGLLVENGTYQVPSIGVYGTTTDGYGFYVYGSGVGPITGQSAQLTIEAGGPYASLAEEYFLAELKPNQARTAVSISAYRVN